MYSCDISSLYTAIPTELGMDAISYWLHKKRKLIPQLFTNDFIIESLKFVLKNNNVFFDDLYLYLYLTIWWHVPSITWNSNEHKCAPSYACLTVGYLKETKRFTYELPKYFNESECKLIMELLKRYMDDGFIFWPLKLNFGNFKTCLNNMHPSSKFKFENPEIIYENEKKVQVLNFSDVKTILHEDNSVETDFYYKPTNTHDYLLYNSAHPDHTKK